MKDRHTVGKKWPEMVIKLAIVIVICFYSEYMFKPRKNHCVPTELDVSISAGEKWSRKIYFEIPPC